jgi:ABC-type antimicrobial peptide transport system permease subunit
VDQAAAQRYWPGISPLGRRLTIGAAFDNANACTVVGVVGNVKQSELAETAGLGALYLPYVRQTDDSFSVIVRTNAPLAAMAPMIRKVVSRLDPELPVDALKPMQVLIDDSLVARRSPAILAAVFAGVALSLSALGTYGVLAYAVSQRRREIGVRMALGAMPGQIGRQFLSLGLRLFLAGAAFGLLGAWIVGRAMQSILFNVPAFHLETLAGMAFVMGVVSWIACLLPALRASHVDPMIALRNE